MKKIPALLSVLLSALLWAGSAHAQGLRPEVGKPLQQAGEYLKAGKSREALAKVREAEAVPNRTPAEQLTIDRMKAAAAQRAGDTATAIQALEGIYARSGPADQGPIAEQLASAHVQARNNAKALEWLGKAQAAGYSSATMKQLQSYLQAASGDYGAIARDAAAAVVAAEQAGRKPEEADLLRLADAQQRTGATAGQIATLEKLLFNYPKKEYWAAYLSRLPRKPNFADRFALDVLRLRLATGNLAKTDEYMEMAQLALQAGLPAEGLRIVDQGFKNGVLGTGAEADRHKRLRDLALKKDQESRAGIAGQAADAAAQPAGDDLVKVGYAYVTLGQADKGIALIEQGIAKGGMKHAEDARLRLGMAQLGKDRPKALKTLRSVGGHEGAAEIARLWTIAGN